MDRSKHSNATNSTGTSTQHLFQVLYHQGWTQAVEKAITGLKSSLLVEHPETKKLYVNMDPHVWELLRETRIMILMELEVWVNKMSYVNLEIDIFYEISKLSSIGKLY